MKRCLSLVSILLLLLTENVSAQDITNLGGDLTTDITGHNAIQVAAPNVTSEERRTIQLNGFTDFHQIVNRAMGLGPKFVNHSCGGCHVQNGKGPVTFDSTFSNDSAMVVKVGLNKLDSFGRQRKIPHIGSQLQNHSVTGKSFFALSLTFQTIEGRYPDGTKYQLRKPKLSFKIDGISKTKIRRSLRMSPLLVGMGLLEAVPESTILALSDEQDSNDDGISGKPNYVLDLRTDSLVLGRFGFKSSRPTVEQQTAAALFGDMGVTSPLIKSPDSTFELSESDFNELVLYQLIPGVPRATSQDDLKVVEGKSLFQSIGCDDCHVMTLSTGDNENPELANQTIHPFTDLLLHDMGVGLDDGFREFSAAGSEWRTTPLWGLGYSKTVSNITPRFLHDGRARTIEEAILWHGGEAATSQQSFKRLTKEERRAVLRFLESL